MSPLPEHARSKLLAAAAPLARNPEDPANVLAALGVDADERYEVVRELGRGGMGIVYEAVDRTLERRVGLKILTGTATMSEDARARFLREAQAAARLSHPNIAAVYDATPDYIAMQLIEGRTLGEIGWKDPRGLAAVVRDAALAVHAAHQQGIVHRDLKPANLMVEDVPEGSGADAVPRVYVMDFGLAKETAVDSSLSTSGSILGTPAYMSPEQAAGRTREVTPRSDVYALGATLYDCLAGHPPFGARDGESRGPRSAGDVYQIIRKTVEEEPERLERVAAGVDRDLGTIVAKCLAKEPERRYSSALALASDLDRWLQGEPILARPPSLSYRARKYLSRRSGALKASLVFAAVAAGLVALIVVPPAMQEKAGREAAERALDLSSLVSQALADAALLARGDVERAHARLDEGVSACEAFLETTETGHGRYFLGCLLRARGRQARARRELDRAVAESPTLLEARFERGLLLAEMRRDRLARAASRPEADEPYAAEIEALRVEALADLEAALAGETDSRSARAHYAHGHRAWLAGDDVVAESEFKHVTRIDSHHSQAHLSLSVFYLEQGNVDLGRRHSVIYTELEAGLGRAYERQPEAAQTASPSNCYVITGLEPLVFDFTAAGSIRPGTSPAYCSRAQVRMEHAAESTAAGSPSEALRRWDQAVTDLDYAVELDPEVAGAWLNRAVCHYERDKRLVDADQLTEAVEARQHAYEDLAEAVRLDPDLSAAWFNRGLLHRRMGMLLWFTRRPDEAKLMWEGAAVDVEQALEGLPAPSLERTHAETVLAHVRSLLEG